MIMIDNATAVVFTPAELSSAISADNGIDYVYLGASIIMTSGIRIYPAKPSLIIDGCYPPENTSFYTLTDSGTDTGQIYINASSDIDLTFQNLIIAGRNYFGMPRVYDVSGTENVTVTYRNVTYTGPQMTWHVRGLTRYIDCDVTITGQPSSGVQEVGEVCKVEIGGVTTMRKTNTDHAVFWFYGSSTRQPYLKILAGANVTITTAHYFMYEAYPPEYIIEPGSSFVLNTNSGISWNSSHAAASFLVWPDVCCRHARPLLSGQVTCGHFVHKYINVVRYDGKVYNDVK